jgi:hypothetical protein
MKYLHLLLLCLSCSISQKQEQKTTSFWNILESYDSSWDNKKILSQLGKPQEVVKQNNKDTWIYNSPETNYQIWAIGITGNKVSGVAYFPSSPEKKVYISEVEERWKSRNCIHKKETKLIADNFQTTRTLECESGRKVAEYNRYNEVVGISVK